MTKNIAEYGHFKKINDPEIIEKIRELNIECERIPPKKNITRPVNYWESTSYINDD